MIALRIQTYAALRLPQTTSFRPWRSKAYLRDCPARSGWYVFLLPYWLWSNRYCNVAPTSKTVVTFEVMCNHPYVYIYVTLIRFECQEHSACTEWHLYNYKCLLNNDLHCLFEFVTVCWQITQQARVLRRSPRFNRLAIQPNWHGKPEEFLRTKALVTVFICWGYALCQCHSWLHPKGDWTHPKPKSCSRPECLGDYWILDVAISLYFAVI